MKLLGFPKVSIGVPVFNGGEYLELVLISLANQDYSNLELIVSDNASQDCTEKVCRNLAVKFKNLIYYRQPRNIGAPNNFEFVLKHSTGKYFMWAAADDIKSVNFISECVSLLEANPHAVAAAGKDIMFNVQDQVYASKWRTFDIRGSREQRLRVFLENCYESNGLFYSLVKTEIAKSFNFASFYELGGDWFFIIDLIASGEILRSQKAYALISNGGVSNGNLRWSAFRRGLIGWLLPFHQFSFYTIKTLRSHSFQINVSMLKSLLDLNVAAAKMQFQFECSLAYASIKAKLFKSS